MKIAVPGATGRMGSHIISLLEEYKDMELVVALEHKEHVQIGMDIGEIIGSVQKGIRLTNDMNHLTSDIDVIIDFTTPSSTLEYTRYASKIGSAVVIGTTGLSEKGKNEIETYSQKIPCLLAPNMSVGVNLLFKLIEEVTKILGQDFDIEIIEAHHRLKKDAPSGTALKMAEVIADTLGKDLEDLGVYARKGMIGERKKDEIGIQTIRAGDIVGEHTVIFGGLGERMELTHRASSRDTFARGAIRAARWIHGKQPGLYDMKDVLGLM